MRRLSRPATIGMGDRVRFAGQVRAVLAVSAHVVTLADESDSPREVPLAARTSSMRGAGIGRSAR
ncbi:hypothetical protein [Streptomyces sp. NPDC059970]|uniref:hypothetical protein n=1 Tax=Streptomyces sp. NPDC059970 TaxID=3347019 RepID=UPI0036A8FC42